MIHIRPQMTESFVPICAGLFVSFVNKCILSNPKLDSCCRAANPEKVDSATDSDETATTEVSDTSSKAFENTAATLPRPHAIHTHHYHYVPLY